LLLIKRQVSKLRAFTKIFISSRETANQFGA
jgi:hypothetical protein